MFEGGEIKHRQRCPVAVHDVALILVVGGFK